MSSEISQRKSDIFLGKGKVENSLSRLESAEESQTGKSWKREHLVPMNTKKNHKKQKKPLPIPICMKQNKTA